MTKIKISIEIRGVTYWKHEFEPTGVEEIARIRIGLAAWKGFPRRMNQWRKTFVIEPPLRLK